MQDVVTFQSIGALIAVLTVLLVVRFSGPGPTKVLLGSLVLIGVAIAHVFFSANVEITVAGLKAAGKIGTDDQELAKSALAKWNIIIPLVVGGLGVNMLSTWSTLTIHK